MTKEVKDVEIPDTFNIDFIELSDGTKLRRLYYHPESPEGILFLFPGMNTLVLSWIKVLNGMAEANFRIDYVESREKHTAKLVRKAELSKERMIMDCSEAYNKLYAKRSNVIALGSSLGSCTLIHCLARKDIDPSHVILVGPALVFGYPLAFNLLFPFTNSVTYNYIGRPFLKKIIIRKYTNEKADPKQKEKYLLALDLAEPNRLKKTLKAWKGSSILDDLPLIDGSVSKCYLIGATEDRLHNVEVTKQIASSISNAEFVDLKTNTAAHDTPIIEMMMKLSD
ncbi:MAG: hypothetical protein ACXAD7_04300 [Candidatus Kariarchaeaceae archaeon]|jgi:hypothetical protein